MSALSVVSTMRFVQTLNIRFGGGETWHCRGEVEQRLLLILPPPLTAFAMFIVNRQRWLVVPQVLVEWATAA